MTRTRAQPDQSSMLCSVEGCTRKWCSDFGRRLCSEHLRSFARKVPPVPVRPPVRPYVEQPDPFDPEELP